MNNCVGVNNHRHFFLYLICLTFGIGFYDWILYNCKRIHALFSPVCCANSSLDFTVRSSSASEVCHVLSADLCKVLNVDPYTLVLAGWATLQLTWVTMLIFTQLVQVSRAMTTYENMYGVKSGSSTTAFTSTGTPLDPNHPSLSTSADAGAHGHRHRGGMFKQWARLLGVDPFIETVSGRGAATGKSKKKKNPYSRGCVGNCRDFWFDPAPVFGPKENGVAMLGGDKVDYTMMYESPSFMTIAGGRRARDGYEVVGTEEV